MHSPLNTILFQWMLPAKAHASAKVTRGGNNKIGNLLFACQTLHCSNTAKALKNDRSPDVATLQGGVGTWKV